MFSHIAMDQYLYIPFLGGMNIHLPAILMFTRGTRFWHTANCKMANLQMMKSDLAINMGDFQLNDVTKGYKIPPNMLKV